MPPGPGKDLKLPGPGQDLNAPAGPGQDLKRPVTNIHVSDRRCDGGGRATPCTSQGPSSWPQGKRPGARRIRIQMANPSGCGDCFRIAIVPPFLVRSPPRGVIRGPNGKSLGTPCFRASVFGPGMTRFALG